MSRYWQPIGIDHAQGHGRHGAPTPGQLIGLAGKAWRVISIDEIHPSQWSDETNAAWEKAGYPDPWDRREVRVLVEPARNPAPNLKDRRGFRLSPWAWHAQWWPLRDPWPECVDCGHLWPCPCDHRNDVATAEMKKLDRLAAILPGCCWACGKPITGRQHSIEFDGENLLLPGGDTVAFHIAGSHKSRHGAPCRAAARDYEQRWVSADPRRVVRLTCPGTQFRHYEDYECTAGQACTGPGADHAAAAHCTTSYYGVGAEQLRPARSCGGKGCKGGDA